MDYNAIRILLDKYWEGETSLEEEALLQTFFINNQEELPEDLAAAAPCSAISGIRQKSTLCRLQSHCR